MFIRTLIVLLWIIFLLPQVIIHSNFAPSPTSTLEQLSAVCISGYFIFNLFTCFVFSFFPLSFSHVFIESVHPTFLLSSLCSSIAHLLRKKLNTMEYWNWSISQKVHGDDRSPVYFDHASFLHFFFISLLSNVHSSDTITVLLLPKRIQSKHHFGVIHRFDQGGHVDPLYRWDRTRWVDHMQKESDPYTKCKGKRIVTKVVDE